MTLRQAIAYGLLAILLAAPFVTWRIAARKCHRQEARNRIDLLGRRKP